MSSDLINGLFELAGAIALSFNVKSLWHYKTIAGIHWSSVIFFTSWGYFNIYFYPDNGLYWSFIGGLFVSAVNTSWLILYAYLKLTGQLKPAGPPHALPDPYLHT